MHTRHGERLVFLILIVGQLVLVVLVASLVMGWWSRSDSEEPRESVASGPEPGIDAPATATPSGSLVLITPSPSLSGADPTPTVSPAPEGPGPALTPVAPSATAPPAARQDPVPPASNLADFAGRWRITDTVTEGPNTGQTYTFDVSLEQHANQISGGNAELQISGVVTGDTAAVEYVQPALGLQGTFAWTMTDPNGATGTFTSSHPNSGTSVLQRLP